MKAKILTEKFTRLPSGYYAVSSDHAVYYQALALLKNKKSALREMGSSLFPYGQKALYFKVGSPIARVRNPAPDDRVAIGETEMRMGEDSYASVKQEYSEWQVKWWREVIQNAVDAGARNVRLDAYQKDGRWYVSCEDDGAGMDQTTFTDVFLVLKASTKRDDQGRNLGGFGEAKKLIVLPWISWTVASRDRVYEGVGKKATIYPAPMRQGTRVEAVMGTGYNEHAEGMHALEVLSRSYYPHVNFLVNGTRVHANYRPTEELFKIGDRAIGYFMKTGSGDTTPYYYVTARDSRNGGVLYMFKKYLAIDSINGNIIIELTGPSKDILTANRDGFRDQQIEQEIQRFTSKASADVMSAFKKSHNLVEKVYEGIGKFKVKRTEEELMDIASTTVPIKYVGNARTSAAESYEVSTQVVEKIITSLNRKNAEEAGEIGVVSPDAIREYLSVKMSGTAQFENALRLISWRPDFYVINEIPGFQIPAPFDPLTMKPRVKKIAKLWAELVRFALIQMEYDGEYGVGWIFSEANKNRGTSRTAAAAKRFDGTTWILLNPFTDDSRNEMFQSSRMDNLETMYAYVVHECTHMVNGISEHNEQFASALTTNMAKCAKGFRKLNAIANSVKMKGDIEL